MRSLLLTLFFATFAAAAASDRPERLTDRPVPTVKLVASIGWRLSGVASMDVERGNVVLKIDGDVFNVSGKERPSPKIRLETQDARGEAIFHWTVSPDQPQVKAGDYATYSARLESPPEAIRGVVISTVED